LWELRNAGIAEWRGLRGYRPNTGMESILLPVKATLLWTMADARLWDELCVLEVNMSIGCGVQLAREGTVGALVDLLWSWGWWVEVWSGAG
jgi:hypothetical protein